MTVGPVARVRDRVRASAGDEVARLVPDGYHRMGHVIALRLPDGLRPAFGRIGAAWLAEPGVEAVLRQGGPVAGDWRVPHAERIAGARTDTEVLESGIRYRFDAAQILFARGNGRERQRAGEVTRPGETVVDLFAGIGYFTLPAARLGRAACVHACEENPTAVEYLRENVRRNGVDRVVRIHPGDNRRAALPRGQADRVFLGLLPSAIPWIPIALPLLKESGGTLHVHMIVGTWDGREAAASEVGSAIHAAGYLARSTVAMKVKAYGPGRVHVVVDACVGGPAP